MSEENVTVDIAEEDLKSMIKGIVDQQRAENVVEIKEEKEMSKEEIKSAVKEVMSEIKSESKMVVDVNVAPKGLKEKRSFAEMLKGINLKDKNIISKYELVRDEKTLVEGTPSLGGFIVPEEFMPRLLDLTVSYSVIRQLATVIPMSGKSLVMPTLTASGATYWVDENGQKTPSDATFGQLALTNYKLCRLQKVSKELLEDSNPAVDGLLMNMFAKSLANAEDLAFIAGTGGAGDPIVGLLNTPGMPTTPAGGSFTFDDVFDAIASVKNADGQNISIVYAPRDYKSLRKLKGNDGQYLWSPAAQGAPATVDGYPIIADKNIPTNLGIGTESIAIVGDFSYAYIGDRQGITITSGLDGDDFSYNRVSFLAEKRVAFKVADATKFNVITGILA